MGTWQHRCGRGLDVLGLWLSLCANVMAGGDFSDHQKPSWVFVSRGVEGTQAFVSPDSVHHMRGSRLAWIGFRFREPRLIRLANSSFDSISIWSEWDCAGERYRYLRLNGYVANQIAYKNLTPDERFTVWRPVNQGMGSTHEALFKVICSSQPP